MQTNVFIWIKYKLSDFNKYLILVAASLKSSSSVEPFAGSTKYSFVDCIYILKIINKYFNETHIDYVFKTILDIESI